MPCALERAPDHARHVRGIRMTAPRLISPAKLRAYAEQCRALGVVVEVKPDGTVRIEPARQSDRGEAQCDEVFGCDT